MAKITVMDEYTVDAKKVYGIEKKCEEDAKKTRVISEKPDGTQILKTPDGRIMARRKGIARHRAMYGCAVKCEGEYSEENLKEAKEKVLEKLFEIVRGVADTVPEDFFIIKDEVNCFTVGCKLELPNVYVEEEGKDD